MSNLKIIIDLEYKKAKEYVCVYQELSSIAYVKIRAVRNLSRISAILSGVSGEHFVAAELSRRGYIASLTSKNTKGIDLLASNEDASKTIGIQVKTNQGSRKAWLLNEKCEDFYSETLYYIFVNLNGTTTPDFYIASSKIVAEYIKKTHQNWLQTPGRKGKKRNDTSMRMFHDFTGEYLNKWESLGLD